MLLEGTRIQLIDVRERVEYELANIGALNIPLSSILEEIEQIERGIPVVIHCQSGQRSRKAIVQLQQLHRFTNLLNMKGGLRRWKEEVDQKLVI